MCVLRVFLLDEDAWRVFDEALNRPAQDVTGLREPLLAKYEAGPTDPMHLLLLLKDLRRPLGD